MASWPPTTTTAKATVLELVDALGFRPVDVGPLARARQLEGIAFLNINRNIVNGGAWQSRLEARRRPIRHRLGH